MTTAPHSRWRRVLLWSAGALLLSGAVAARSVMRLDAAARLLLASLDPKGAPPSWLGPQPYAVDARDEWIVLRGGQRVRSRSYEPRARANAPVLLVWHGVHPLGIDEPRQQRLARAFAASGLHVHTPELAALLSLEVGPQLVPEIAAIAAELSARHGGRKVGGFGISFTGGLLLMAAATPEGERALGYVVAVGAHHDLQRVVRYYAGDQVLGPAGEQTSEPADPYGARVLVAAYAQALFDPGDVVKAREVLRLFLAEHYQEARVAAQELSTSGRERMQQALDRGPKGLAPLLETLARTQPASLAELSPKGHLAGLRAPSLVLHGLSDPIVPSLESSWLAREVPKPAFDRLLLTPALRHAEGAKQPSLFDQLALVRFVAAVLAHADDTR